MEDLSPGMSFTSGTRALDEAQIIAFASQFDPQPFHLDDAAAQATLFGGLAASGWHCAAITMKLLVACTPIAGGMIGGACEISWPRPTRPGDVLQVTSEIIEVTPSRSKPERGMAVFLSHTRNQAGEVLQILTSKVVVLRRPA
jgi:acyl dehydratase